MTEIGIAVSVAAFSMHDGIAVRGTLFFLRVSIFRVCQGADALLTGLERWNTNIPVR